MNMNLVSVLHFFLQKLLCRKIVENQTVYFMMDINFGKKHNCAKSIVESHLVYLSTMKSKEDLCLVYQEIIDESENNTYDFFCLLYEMVR